MVLAIVACRHSSGDASRMHDSHYTAVPQVLLKYQAGEWSECQSSVVSSTSQSVVCFI